MKIILNTNIDTLPQGVLPIASYHNYLLNILVNLGYSEDRPPVGELLQNTHDLEGKWVVVSPINWQATHNDSMLVASSYDFSLSEQQSEILFAKFSEFVVAEGMELYKHDDVTWLLKVQDKPLLNAKSVYSVLHQSLMNELENLDSSLYWQKFITMSQMFFSNFHLHDDKNIYPINGVWVWGEGHLNDKTTKQIIALDANALQIAKQLSSNCFGYSDALFITKDAMFVASSTESLASLPEKYLQKINYWYWNNQAYQLQSSFKTKIQSIYKAMKCALNKKN